MVSMRSSLANVAHGLDGAQAQANELGLSNKRGLADRIRKDRRRRRKRSRDKKTRRNLLPRDANANETEK
eukprot:scaffold135511_cov35-Attheya_sp.AAC.1